jgi:protein-tyrosine phosphatase
MSLQLYTGNGFWDAGAVDGYPWLFVGSLSAAESHVQLQAKNITRLLTVAGRLPVAAVPDGVEHLQVDIDDHPSANFLDVAAKCSAFIDSAAASAAESNEEPSCSILVHCASGASRSITAVMAWLMDTQRGHSLNEALEAARINRPLANPNPGFISQLQVLEKHNGCLEPAIIEWKASSNTGFLERTAAQRQLANDIHAAVDELEVKIQTFRSSGYARTDINSSSEDAVTRGSLLREAISLSDRLDTSQGNFQRVPEGRIAMVIFKSARSKVERLISTLDGCAIQ